MESMVPIMIGILAAAVVGLGVGLIRQRAAAGRVRDELVRARSEAEAEQERVRRVDAEIRSDLEHLAASERELEAVLRSTIDGIIVADESGTIVRFNRAAERLFGWEVQEAVGQNLTILMTPADAELHDAYIEQYRETSRGQIIGLARDVIAQRKDGTTLPIGLAVSEFWLDDQRFFCGVARSIAMRKREEQDLLLAQRSAEELARVKSEFLANMSHEIRTPMNGVLGMVTLLQDTTLDHEQTDFLDTIHSSAHALLDIINDILDFSKNDAGRLDLEYVPLDLERACHDVICLLGPQAEEKGLDLELLYAGDAPRYVVGDPTRLRQILMNLVGNAIKFTTLGHVWIEVRSGPAENGLNVQLLVRDTGIGIPAPAQATLFEPFSQAESSTTREYGGTGLGLAICRQLTEAMEGEISLESSPRKGTTFCVSLPLQRDPNAPEPTPTALESKRCLVALESPVSQAALRMRLERLGLLAEAVDPADLPAYLKDESRRPDVVILEHRPPKIDADALARQLHDASGCEKVPAVRLSPRGAATDILMTPGVGLGARLAKPAFVDTLRDVLLAALGLGSKPRLAEVTDVSDAQLTGRILLAEDNLVNQRVSVAILEKLGLEVVVAGDGVAAVNAVEAGAYDMVFMDCRMPKLDGLEATRAIRRAETGGEFRLPIVALTASALARDRERCLEAGMDDYLTKPFSRPDLVRVLTKWLPSEAAATGS